MQSAVRLREKRDTAVVLQHGRDEDEKIEGERVKKIRFKWLSALPASWLRSLFLSVVAGGDGE